MNGLANLGWALLSIIAAAAFLIILIADRAEVGRRLRQGVHLITEAGPWLVAAVLDWACRERSPSPAHPAARALACACDACTTDLDPVAFARWEHEIRAGRQA